jgi:4'-phosphopantetheinyl transferase
MSIIQAIVEWQPVPMPVVLEPGTIDVWRIGLEVDAATQGQLRSRLSEDEQIRADRFRYDHHRDRFIVARASLRQLLGQYQQQDPADVQFHYGRHGKPGIAGLEFNLSHSANLALLAVSRDRPVGIDLEWQKPVDELEKLTARFFTAGEHQRIIQVPVADRPLAFFRTWTCKEAYLKATGEGIGQLKSLEVWVQPQQPPYFVHPPDWSVQELAPEQGFVGALVAPGMDWQARFWHYS